MISAHRPAVAALECARGGPARRRLQRRFDALGIDFSDAVMAHNDQRTPPHLSDFGEGGWAKPLKALARPTGLEPVLPP